MSATQTSGSSQEPHFSSPLSDEDLRTIKELAEASTGGECGWGYVDPALDPVAWFAEVIGKREEEGRHLCVVTAEQQHESGDYLFVAITGNGPDSEANALFFHIAREATLALHEDLLRQRKQSAALREVVGRAGEMCDFLVRAKGLKPEDGVTILRDVCAAALAKTEKQL